MVPPAEKVSFYRVRGGGTGSVPEKLFMIMSHEAFRR
jgi:hypothetical protein